MADIGSLIRELRRERGLSQQALGHQIGEPYQRVGNWERGERAPTWDQARALGDFFNRDPNDFYRSKKRGPDGETEPDDNGRTAFQYDDPTEAYTRPWPVPLEDTAAFCPHGCVYFDQAFFEKFDVNPVHCRVIGIRDSSMYPTLPGGSICLVDQRKRELLNGGVYAFKHEGELLIRRVHSRQSRWSEVQWELTADAGDQKPIWWSGEIEVIGAVIWMARMIGSDFATRPELVVAS